MFNDDFLGKIFVHPEMCKIPFGCQSTAVRVFEEVLEDILEVNPYAAISELLSTTTDNESVSAEFQPEYADAESLYG